MKRVKLVFAVCLLALLASCGDFDPGKQMMLNEARAAASNYKAALEIGDEMNAEIQAVAAAQLFLQAGDQVSYQKYAKIQMQYQKKREEEFDRIFNR
jgi:hypothetical protein